MFEQEVTITAQNGLDMRPITELVTAAKTFTSTMRLTAPDGRSASLRRPLDLLGLGLKQDSVVTVQAEGEDAKAAVECIVQLLQGMANRDTVEDESE